MSSGGTKKRGHGGGGGRAGGGSSSNAKLDLNQVCELSACAWYLRISPVDPMGCGLTP